MEPLFLSAPGNVPVDALSPVTLAYVGDSVYELLVRTFTVAQGNVPAKELHRRSVALSNCAFQAKALRCVLEPLFTLEEADICRRGRNAHVGHVPKNAQVADYHAATALECLFGYLYLSGRQDRLAAFFEAVTDFAKGESSGSE